MCLLSAAVAPSLATGTEISEGWWAPGDPAPTSFGFAEGSKTLPDGRTAYRIHFLADESTPVFATRSDHRQGPPPTGYRLPEVGGQILRAIAEDSPRAGHVVLGHSVEGIAIDALWMGQPPGSGVPVFRILGGHHGDEWASFEVPLALAETLAAGDGVIPEITDILETSTVWIAPYVNPDGIIGGTRYNAAFVDLNRNYDFAWNPLEFLPGDHPFSEPETRAVRANSHYDLPFAALSYHSGATNIGYVWNYTLSQAADRDLLIDLSEAYADTTADPDFWVTNGAAWYTTAGDTNDWSYGRYGVLDFTVEVTLDKAPPPEQIGDFVPGHVDAAIDFLANRPTLSGTVVDKKTGLPLMALLTLDVPTAPFYSDPVGGHFHRITAAGEVEISASAIGYEPITERITAPDTDVTLRLTRTGDRDDALWPRLIHEPTLLFLPLAWSGPVELHRPGSEAAFFLAEAGVVEVDPRHLSPGAWSVRVGNETWLHSLIVAEELVSVSRESDQIRIEGEFSPGSRAWVLQGNDRPLRRLSVLTETATTLTVDATEIDESGRVDVMVLSGGRHLALADIHDMERDPPIITDDIIVGVPVGCACATGTGHLGLHPLSVLLLLLIRRRST